MSSNVVKSSYVVLVNGDEPMDDDTVADLIEEARLAGVAEGEARATARLEDEVAQLHQVIVNLTESISQQVTKAAQLDAATITDLSIDLANWFLEGAVDRDGSAVLTSLQLPSSGVSRTVEVTLAVHPDVAEALADRALPRPMTIQPDPSLGRADHRLITDGTAVERCWSDAVERVRSDIEAALDGARPQGES